VISGIQLLGASRRLLGTATEELLEFSVLLRISPIFPALVCGTAEKLLEFSVLGTAGELLEFPALGTTGELLEFSVLLGVLQLRQVLIRGLVLGETAIFRKFRVCVGLATTPFPPLIQDQVKDGDQIG